MPNCSSCRREILFVTSPNGKTMPVDATPVVVWSLTTLGDTTTAQRAAADERLYISHFATCPFAAQHSRARATPRRR